MMKSRGKAPSGRMMAMSIPCGLRVAFVLLCGIAMLVTLTVHREMTTLTLWGQQQQQSPHSTIPKVVLEENSRVCAVFVVFGKNPRYLQEVEESMARLKSRNPDIYVILATENRKLVNNRGNTNVADRIDILELPQKKMFSSVPLLRQKYVPKGWLLRTQYLARMSRNVPECRITISLDSHVTTCTHHDLYRRMEEFYRAGHLLGTNIENAPYRPWNTTPFTFWKSERTLGQMPHNFAILFVKHHLVDELFAVWENILLKEPGDDQKPLEQAMQITNFTHTRLPENFALALKSIDRRKFGHYPRFTYVIDGNVTLFHSTEVAQIPKEFDGDFCEFLNSQRDHARMVFLEKENGNGFEFLTSSQECERRLEPYEPRICTDSGLFHDGAQWPL